MKSIKIIGSALLFLLLTIGASFAESDADKLKKLNTQIKSLNSELNKVKPKFDTKIQTLLNNTSSDAPDINTANLLIRSLERELQRITPTRSCIDDHPFEAETECPFYTHFYSAAEFIGSNEFAEAFARGGIQLRSSLMGWEGNKGIQHQAQSGFVVGKVTYPDITTDPPGDSSVTTTKFDGELIYIKTTFIDDLPKDVVAYRNLNPLFPDQPTSDQFFDEKQFEAYRMLGRTIGEDMISNIKAVGISPQDPDEVKEIRVMREIYSRFK
jgi:hypothetical protein